MRLEGHSCLFDALADTHSFQATYGRFDWLEDSVQMTKPRTAGKRQSWVRLLVPKKRARLDGSLSWK
jgi:hypothetical protein